MSDQYREPAGGDQAAVEVAQVDAVVAGEVGLYLVAILIEQGEEAS